MTTLPKIIQIIQSHKKDLFTQFHVKKISIFGSYARGKQTNKSDLDILVEFSQPVGFFKFMDLEEYLQKLLHTKIDLVTKKALRPRIGKQILKETVPV